MTRQRRAPQRLGLLWAATALASVLGLFLIVGDLVSPREILRLLWGFPLSAPLMLMLLCTGAFREVGAPLVGMSFGFVAALCYWPVVAYLHYCVVRADSTRAFVALVCLVGGPSPWILWFLAYVAYS